MFSRTPLLSFSSVLVIFGSLVAATIAPGSTSWATQGFYFDWNNDTLPLPTPITAQCETINVKWNRGAGVGPDPAAPYIIKLYTSMYLKSFVIDAGSGLSKSLPIPFDPGSQYVMCMTDLSGISGGCQDLYTVYPSGNTSCQNVTVPENALGVKMTSSETGGLLSRFGWPASCTDLQFDLVDGFNGGIIGKPPYQLTVAPAFRTPLNITFDSSVRWTVVLDHGHPFFVSVTDSEAVSWVNGPLHAGAGSQDCFGPAPPYPWLTLQVSLGMSFSFLILGLLLALIGVWFYASRRPARFSSPERSNDKRVEPYSTESQTKSASSRGGTRRESRSRPVGSGSGSGNSNLLSGLHLRRPSNNKAPSSEMVLMRDRPTLRRDQTSGALDLAASPIEEHAQLPFSGDPEGFTRRPSATDGIFGGHTETGVEPWTHGQSPKTTDERGIIQASLGYPVSPPPLKHRPKVASTSSDGSRASAVPSTDGTRLSTAQESSTTRPQSTRATPPRSNSGGSSTMPTPLGPVHRNSSTSVPVMQQLHNHSPPVATNTDGSGYFQHRQHQNLNYQQQQHDVYVVHHDAGLPPPVTVFTRPGMVVTELPPGYENLIPNPRHDEVPANVESSSNPMSKAGPSTSNSSSPPLTLDTSGNQNQLGVRTAGGMGLVNSEDMPLSAISSPPTTASPPKDPHDNTRPES